MVPNGPWKLEKIYIAAFNTARPVFGNLKDQGTGFETSHGKKARNEQSNDICAYSYHK